MWPFSAKTAGNLSLNYNEIAGYTLNWLPCSARALAVAFPHLTVKAEQIPAYHYGQMEHGFALYGADTQTPALCVAADGKTGYALLIRSQYNPTEARNSYVKLADLAVYNADPETVKANIKAPFTGDDDPEAVAQNIAQMFDDDWQTIFWFTLDWKADIADLTAQIKTALGDKMGQVTLPGPADFPANGSVGTPGVFQAFASALQAAGLDLWFVDNPTDTHFLFIAKTSDRKRIAKLFEPTQINASPFEA